MLPIPSWHDDRTAGRYKKIMSTGNHRRGVLEIVDFQNSITTEINICTFATTLLIVCHLNCQRTVAKRHEVLLTTEHEMISHWRITQVYNNDIILIYEGLALYLPIGRKYLLTHTRCVRGVIMKGYLKKKKKLRI